MYGLLPPKSTLNLERSEVPCVFALTEHGVLCTENVWFLTVVIDFPIWTCSRMVPKHPDSDLVFSPWILCFKQNLYHTLIMFLWRKTLVAPFQVESINSYVCVPICCWEGVSMNIVNICFFKSHLFLISCSNFHERYHLLNVCYSKSIPAYPKSLLLIGSSVSRPAVSLVMSSFWSCWLSWSHWR